jgi:hypothetical protein
MRLSAQADSQLQPAKRGFNRLLEQFTRKGY